MKDYLRQVILLCLSPLLTFTQCHAQGTLKGKVIDDSEVFGVDATIGLDQVLEIAKVHGVAVVIAVYKVFGVGEVFDVCEVLGNHEVLVIELKRFMI